jgi:hypothetical protein
LTEVIEDAQVQVRNLQNTCPHETSVYSARGSTGNWDWDDSYWYEHHCYDCGKRWTTEQKPEFRSRLEVKTVDYSASPREIELLIELEAERRIRK